MNTLDDQAIAIAAKEFRSALDRIDRLHWEARFISDFPRGGCGHCAELLGRYLCETLAIEATYVSGRLWFEGTWNSHAWLEIGDFIVDISGDQFGLASVIVTRSSPFHATASEVERCPLTRDGGWWNEHCGAIWIAATAILKPGEYAVQ